MFHHRRTLAVFNGFSELPLEKTQILAECFLCVKSHLEAHFLL